jgi:hypothetical protein
MRWFLDRLRGRKRREAEEALARLGKESAQGPEAARRFEEAARKIINVPKSAVKPRT